MYKSVNIIHKYYDDTLLELVFVPVHLIFVVSDASAAVGF